MPDCWKWEFLSLENTLTYIERQLKKILVTKISKKYSKYFKTFNYLVNQRWVEIKFSQKYLLCPLFAQMCAEQYISIEQVILFGYSCDLSF